MPGLERERPFDRLHFLARQIEGAQAGGEIGPQRRMIGIDLSSALEQFACLGSVATLHHAQPEFIQHRRVSRCQLRGSREKLHLVERWTRTSPTTLDYVAIIEDPTVWTRPWTVTQEFSKQNEQENRIYYEPRCWEGNFGHPAVLRALSGSGSGR